MMTAAISVLPSPVGSATYTCAISIWSSKLTDAGCRLWDLDQSF